jgi:hypothetical protein
MPVQTLDQQIAAATHGAYDRLKTTVHKAELPGYIKKTATRLRVSGLGVTTAFCLKDKDLSPIAKELATILAALKLPVKAGDAEDLLAKYRTASATEIRRLQTYAEQSLEWLSKWADTYKQKG